MNLRVSGGLPALILAVCFSLFAQTDSSAPAPQSAAPPPPTTSAQPTLAQQPATPDASTAPATDAVTPPADVAEPTVNVDSGERMVLELQEGLNSSFSQRGDLAHFTTMREVMVGPELVIPAGSSIQATLTEVKSAGRRSRPGEITLQFDEIILPDGTKLPFKASVLRAGFTRLDDSKDGIKVKGEGGMKGRDAISVASGAGQGALIGVMMGGAKGAAYGGAIGAGVGLIQILMQKGPELDLPRGMMFEVELDEPLQVPEASVARFSQPGAPASFRAATAPAASMNGGFQFPDELGASAPPGEPIPDFPDDDTAEETAGTQSSSQPTLEPGRQPDANTETASQESVEGETTEIAVGKVPPPPGTTVETPATTEAPPVLGPPPPPEEEGAFRMKVDVRLVTVEAFVRDQRGRVMDSLKREDFRIFEDNVEQQVTTFSRDELPLAVALVVDRSGSVAPFMPELRRAAYDTLTQLKPGDQVALFAFDSEVDRLENLTTDRRRIAERIAGIRAGGGTNITDALAMALQYLAAVAPDRRRVVILISDNEATTRGYTDQGDVIRMGLESESVIYSIKTTGQPTPLTMKLPNWMGGLGSVRKITQETGGEVIDVDRVGSLKAALATVVSRLKTRYTLGYNSTNKARDGSFRHIRVELADRYGRPEKDYDVFARSGYYAPHETRTAQAETK